MTLRRRIAPASQAPGAPGARQGAAVAQRVQSTPTTPENASATSRDAEIVRILRGVSPKIVLTSSEMQKRLPAALRIVQGAGKEAQHQTREDLVRALPVTLPQVLQMLEGAGLLGEVVVQQQPQLEPCTARVVQAHACSLVAQGRSAATVYIGGWHL